MAVVLTYIAIGLFLYWFAIFLYNYFQYKKVLGRRGRSIVDYLYYIDSHKSEAEKYTGICISFLIFMVILAIILAKLIRYGSL